MSKDGHRTHAVQISSNGWRHRITVDGVDLSHGLRGAVLTIAPGELPTLAIDPVIYELDATELQPARVIVDDHAAKALIALGWTPPKEAT
jgi:hypothetical protein